MAKKKTKTAKFKTIGELQTFCESRKKPLKNYKISINEKDIIVLKY